MGVSIDTTGYQAANKGEPDTKNQALWTFAIQDCKINCWGRYAEAATTAARYAETHGMSTEAIRLLDCTGAWRGITRH